MTTTTDDKFTVVQNGVGRDSEPGSDVPAGSSQRLDRFVTLKPATAFGLTVLSSWTSLGLTIGSALLNGGPTTLIYGTILSGVGTFAIAASLGELASITPVVGAQYRWSGLYAPRVMTPAFWSLLQGWLTVFSWICLCAFGPFLSAMIIQGLIILNVESYVPQRWHTTLLMWAYLGIPILCNIYARKTLKAIEIAGGIMYVCFFIITVVVLVAMSPRSTAEFVFTESFFGRSGWESEGIQWCIGLLSITSLLTGFDGVLHLSDEITNARRKVPQAMMWAVALNVVMALAFVIALLFCIGNVDAVLSTPTGFPIIQIFYQTTKSKAGATILTCLILVSTAVGVFGVFASVSRLTWAFARDKGLPFSSFFSCVHPTLRIPLNALGLVVTIAALLGLINIGNTTAFIAILSLPTMGLYLSYVIPLFFVLLRKLRGNHPPYGPFHLGKWSIPVNIAGLAFGIFIVIFSPFPPMQPVTAANMNYAGPILGAVLILALIDWFISGRKRFQVPTSLPEGL